MFVSPDKKNDLCISSIQIVSIKDKIRSLCIFCCCFKPTIFFNVFSDFNKLAEKRNVRTEKLAADPNFGQKKSESFRS